MKRVPVLMSITALLLCGSVAFGLSACARKNSGTAAKGSAVKVQYSLIADGASVVPDSRPETMTVRIGEGKVPPLLENALIGLPVGALKAVQLKPEQAFGPVRKELIARVPRTSLPAGEIKEGMIFGGGATTARVAKILEDGSVVIDRNHPLAGKNLIYKIRVTAIE